MKPWILNSHKGEILNYMNSRALPPPILVDGVSQVGVTSGNNAEACKQ